jgi:predicted pyridoxine 5'-phosphate oxidase superfamily flavin-nucleotide-binding protein
MPHEPRLTRELRALLQAQRVATLGTLNADGSPLVSMVPFALRTDEAGFVIHVSGLAAHTANSAPAAHGFSAGDAG